MVDLSKKEWEKYADQEDAHLCMTVSSVMSKGITSTELMQKYAEWAHDGKYDKDLSTVRKQGGPFFLATLFAEAVEKPLRATYRILDVGAGTGFAAERLRDLGFFNIDALDPSKEMLEKAKEKHLYKQFFNEFLTEDRLPIETGTYDGLAACGCFVEGHVQCAGLHEMIRVVKPGGIIVIVTRYEYLQIVDEYRDRLEPLMDRLEAEGKWSKISRQIQPKYYLDKEAIVWEYRVL